MGYELEAVDFAYVDSDIPLDTSIREWRAQRAVCAAAARQARRARRRRRWRAALLPWTFPQVVARCTARRRRTASGPIDRKVPA